MLIIFGGLPGTGKTTLARELARRLLAAYLRIDTIEQAIIRSGVVSQPGPAGYYAAHALAAENLALGSTVVADAVNPLTIVRDLWKQLAENTGVRCVEIEVICSDAIEHRRRVESRQADIPGHKLPSWQDVLDLQYEPWKHGHVVIDTATASVSQSVDDLIQRHIAVQSGC